MIDLRPLVKPQFWLDTTPPPLSAGNERLVFIIFAIFLIFGAIVRMVASRRQEDRHVTEVFSRLGRMGVTMGIVGLMLFFFSFEELPFLAARGWYLVWTAGLIAWLATIVRYVIKVIPAERAAELARQEKAKYMPKPRA